MRNQIKLISVDIKDRIVKIPVAEIYGHDTGPKLLITAGMDGDENSGIEAAYKIIEKLKDGRFRGQIIVIPIVNIPGFEANRSFNPLDSKFPKDVYPGKKDGSSSERLIYWLDHYISLCDVWIDLHGGASDENLEPCLLIYESKNEKVDALLFQIIRKVNIPKIIFHEPHFWSKIDLLATKDIAYMITEAGYSGIRSSKWINKHIELVETVMGVLGMIKKRKKRQVSPRVYRRRLKLKASKAGLWYPNYTTSIQKDQLMGKIVSFDGEELEYVRSKENGEFLWGKENMICKKGDVLVEIGVNKLIHLPYTSSISVRE